MRSVVSRRLLRARLSIFSLCLMLSGLCSAAGCSIPNLEPPECTGARDVVREFYSFHFGNGLTYTADDLEKRSQFLTPDLYQRLTSEDKQVDPFTLTDDPPKAFRVGACEVTDSGVRFDVLLFWKTDTRTEQRPIHVVASNTEGRWLIASITE